MIYVTAGVIQNKKGQILIAKRKDGKHLAGFWEFPGGKIELDETPELCLIREILEELNILIVVKQFIIDSIFEYEDRTICLKGYYAFYQEGEITMTDHSEYRWISQGELDDFKFAPADIPIIKAITNVL